MINVSTKQIIWRSLCLLCYVHVDPLLLDMTVKDLEVKLVAAMERISCLEGQVHHLSYQQWQLMQQLNIMQQQQQSTACRMNTSFTDSQFEGRGNWQSNQLQTPVRQDSPRNVQQPALQQPSTEGPRATSIKPRSTVSYLPSSSIPKDQLKNPEDVIRKYPKLHCESKSGKLAVKLAREAFFGEEVLSRCTVNGFRELPALPLAELNELKQTLLMQFPKYWNSVQEFESLWIICCDAIGQAAKALRARAKPGCTSTPTRS